MKYKLFLVIVFIIAGCSKTIEEKYPNGNIKVTGTMKSDKMVGEWIYYYENGKIKAKGTFANGNGTDTANKSGIPKDGRDGIWSFYTEDGVLESEYIYENFVRKTFHEYHKNGVLKTEMEFDLDKKDSPPIKDIVYNEVGKVTSYFKESKDTTVYSFYFDDGNIKTHTIFVKGEKISEEIYRKDGSYVGKLLIKHDLKNYKVYYTNDVDSVSTYTIAKFFYNAMVAKSIKENPEITYECFIDKSDMFRFGFKIKEGLHTDASVLIGIRNICNKCSRNALDGKKIEAALCDDDFNILRIVLP